MSRLAIIIPYYQREKGILSRAITSVFAQKNANIPYEIIVVDDGSPIPASEELAAFDHDQRALVRIIRQINSGPGAARNAALDTLDIGTSYVAFLDSDDRWTDQHLANALHALSSGFDFYFSDHFQLEQSVSAFNRAKRINPSDHKRFNDIPVLYSYQGDMVIQILTGNVIGTSTVAYRFEKFPMLRFIERYRNAGEDYCFWIDLSQRTRSIAFSIDCECIYGKGINLYSGAIWGSQHSLHVLQDDIAWRKSILKHTSLEKQIRNALLSVIRRKRVEFQLVVLHRIRHRLPISYTLLARQLKIDPFTFCSVPFAFWHRNS
jgi:succinoglycan biosynthesis protein ExoW